MFELNDYESMNLMNFSSVRLAYTSPENYQHLCKIAINLACKLVAI